LAFGGSAVREEATGYGAVYFLQSMLERCDRTLEGKRIAISGSGNVALFAAERALKEGACVVTLSDSDGFVSFENGIDEEGLQAVKRLKLDRRGRLSELEECLSGVAYFADQAPWGVACDVAMPCATQNELDAEAAKTLVSNGTRFVVEGANMPLTDDAVRCFRHHGVLVAPGKAANAGGVGVSGLEQSQNATRVSWSREKVNGRLEQMMQTIHDKCVQEMEIDDRIDYIDAANRAGFRKVADAMVAYGVV
jgi:glutamate dehydrogenase (NADP+)